MKRRLSGILVAILLTIAVVTALSRGKLLVAGVVLLIGVVLMILPPGGDDVWLEPRLHDGGLLLPARPARRSILLTMSVLTVLLFVSSLISFFQALSLDSVAPAVSGAVMVLVGGVVLRLAVVGFRSHLRPEKGVLLRPDGVVVSSRRPPLQLPWSEVVVGGSDASVDPAEVAMDPEVVVGLLRHYVSRTSDRSKLGTDASLPDLGRKRARWGRR